MKRSKFTEQQRLLPIEHHHVVFTVPDTLHVLSLGRDTS